jgi:hypothetical protein
MLQTGSPSATLWTARSFGKGITMAEFIKLRTTALKAGVSLALAALIGGLPSRSHAATRASSAANATHFLKLTGLTGNVKNSFLKLEKSFLKIDGSLATLEHKLAKTYFTSQKIDSTFLKIKSADTDFLKIDTANASFLKIDDANASFLKIDDAATEFLKVGATAANTSEFGGATAQSFSRSTSGAATIPLGGSAPLLATPDGELSVSVSYGIGVGQGPQATVTITNNTNQALPAVQDIAGTDTSADIPAKSTHTITLSLLSGGADQIHLQFFPVPGLFGSATAVAATLIVSVESSQTGAGFVGQLIAGSL